MTVILDESKKKEDEKNEIDESFKEYIGKVKPPNSHKEWWVYIGIMWANAFSMGVNLTLKEMQKEIDLMKEGK